jgi:hypothetical protein
MSDDARARAIPFDELQPAPEAPGIDSETQDVGGHRWARVHYGPGVLREAWCDEGHCGYVVAGSITYEFQDGSAPLRLRAGQGFALPGAHVHRGRAGDAGAELFLIDREPV